MLQMFSRHVLRRLNQPIIGSKMAQKISDLNVAPDLVNLPINRLVWIDMEMTGLNINEDQIMEVACLITDSNLNIVAEGPDIIIYHPEKVLNNMNDWCIKQHGKTGLTKACLESKITVEQAENTILDFLRKHVTENYSPLAGNSVYIDRLFLRKFMPTLDEFLHYRIIDVSTVKELCRRWNSDLFKEQPKKEYSHRALADIKESVEELKFFKENFFKCI